MTLPSGTPILGGAPIRRWGISLTTAIVLGLLPGCVSVPRAAPQLSQLLGERIGELQTSHLALVHAFFDEKRKAVDLYFEEKWIPTFSQKFFADPGVQDLWGQITQANAQANDRVQFLVVFGPKIAQALDRQRRELRTPLDQLEAAIQERLIAEYTQVRQMNDRLTSFLDSSATLSSRQSDVLAKAGLSQEAVGSVLDQADKYLSQAMAAKASVEQAEAGLQTYRAKFSELINKIKHP